VRVMVEDGQNWKSSQHDAVVVVVVDRRPQDLVDPSLTMMTAVEDHID
jgi:hypothetical protein